MWVLINYKLALTGCIKTYMNIVFMTHQALTTEEVVIIFTRGVRTSIRKTKKKHATTLNGAWWVTLKSSTDFLSNIIR